MTHVDQLEVPARGLRFAKRNPRPGAAGWSRTINVPRRTPMKRLAVLIVTALLLTATAAPAQDKKETKLDEETKRAEAQVKAYLDKIKNAGGGQILYLDNDVLDKAFPKHKFFAVRYRLYPVARVIPEGMKPSNVFVVPPGGRAEYLKDTK